MPRRKKSPLERVRQARLNAIELFTAVPPGTEPLSAEHLRAFRELCESAEKEAREETEIVDVAALSERLQALIDAHNQLSDIVEGMRRQMPERRSGLRMG